MAEMDSLNISISANATKASKSIDTLVGKLNTLSNGLNRISGNQLRGLGDGVEKLGNSMKSLQGVKTTDFNKVANAFKKFADIDSPKISAVAGGITRLASGMATLGSIGDLKGVSSVVNAVRQLSAADMSGFDSTKFTELATSISTFATQMSTVGEIDSKVTRLVSAVARLANSGEYIDRVVTHFPTLSKSVETFTRNMTRISGVDANITKLVDGIARLASAGNKTADTAKHLDDLGNAVLRLLNNLKSAPQINTNLANTILGLGNLAQSGGRVSVATGTASSGTTKFGNALKGLKDKLSSATKSSKGLVSQIGMFYAKMFLVIRAVKSLGKSVKSSMDYIETLNYFNAGFGQVAENANLNDYKKYGYKSAEAYYDSFSKRAEQLTQKMSGYKVLESGMAVSTDEKSLGIDPNLVMNYQTQFAQMSSSMGVASETAVQLSSTLTRLGADLASVKNLDFKNVWEDMSSGLVGMSRTLDKYGTNIRNVNLQQKATELGISTSVASMNQQNKALLRTIILLDSTRYAWGDMSKTIQQPANQLRLLKSNWDNLSRTIGNIFLPIVAKVLPYLNALVIMLQKAAEAIVKFLGFDKDDWGGFSGTGGGGIDIGDLADDSGDLADNMDKTAKKAKKAADNLQGFDIINKLQDTSDDDDGKSTKPDTSLSDLQKMEDALAKLTDEYDKVWNDAFKDMENKAQELANTIQKKLVGAFNKLKQTAEPTLKAIKKLWDEGLSKFAKFTFKNLENFYNNFLKPIGEWLLGDESGLPRFFEITNDLLNEIDWDKLEESLANFYTALQKPTKFVWTALMDFYESFLKPLATWTFSEAIPKLADAFTVLISRIDWKGANSTFKSIFGFLSTVLKDIASAIVNIVSKLLPKLAPIINNIMGILKELIDRVLMPLWNIYKTYILPIFEGIITALGGTILSQIQIFTYGIKDALGGFLDFVTGIFTGDFSKALGGIKTIINTFLDVINDTIENIANGYKDAFVVALNAIKRVWGGIASWFGTVWENIKKSFKGVGSWFKNKFGDDFDNVKKVWKTAGVFFGTVWEGIKEAFPNVAGWFEDKFKSAWDKIEIVWSVAKVFFGKIFDGIKDAAKNPLDTLLGMFEGVANTVIDAFNAIKEMLNKISFKVPDWVPKIGGKSFGFNFEKTEHISLTSKDDGKTKDSKNQKNDTVSSKAVKNLMSLNKQLKSGKISQKEYDAEVEKLNKTMASGTKEQKEYIEALKSSKSNIGGVYDSLSKVSKKDFTAKLKTTVEGKSDIDSTKTALDSIKDKNVTATVTASADTKSASESIDNLSKSKTVTFKATADTTTLQQKLDSLKTKSIKIKPTVSKDLSATISEQLKLNPSIKNVTITKNAKGQIAALLKDNELRVKKIAVQKPTDMKQFEAAFPWAKKINNNELSPIAWYATGGFPDRGQLFLANEAGAEMVGSMNGRTTVANQQEIAQGFATAITNTLAPVMYEAFRQAARETMSETGGDVYLDGRKITESVIKHTNQISRQNGKSPIWGVS